jgi:hypothetical protein
LCLIGSEKMSVVHSAACGDSRCNRSGQEPEDEPSFAAIWAAQQAQRKQEES